jgi:hypothetical protein
MHEARGQAGLADQVGARRDIHRRGKIHAAEYDAGIRLRGPQSDVDLLSRVQAYAAGADQGLKGALP